jgi:hypothetical protein
MARTRVLILPGWDSSGPAHWQTRWEQLHGYVRVEQDDWLWPKRGDWMARLEEVLLQSDTPAVLVAHSLGCLLVAAWAAHSSHTARVHGALLVAPPDVEREDTPPNVAPWRPIVRGRLPFASIAVLSTDDPFCVLQRGRGLAADWGAAVVEVGAAGHINGESRLGDWPAGHALLADLISR